MAAPKGIPFIGVRKIGYFMEVDFLEVEKEAKEGWEKRNTKWSRFYIHTYT